MFLLTTTVLFYFAVFVSSLNWLYLWQIKEYRPDRLMVHIKETKQGERIFYSNSVYIRFGILITFLINSLLNIRIDNILFLATLIYFSGISLHSVRLVQQHKIKIPILTKKMYLIILLVFTLTVIGQYITPFNPYSTALIWYSLTPLWVSICIILFWIPSIMLRKITITKAMKKMTEHKNITVIGITGSYGKGSVKEYLFTLLSTRYKTVKTPETINTPIGIARTVLGKIDKSTEMFVVEMGAYKIGEIKNMCRIVKPKIGVITAVNEQHVSLFGSVQNTLKAKYELIQSLSKDGSSYFNGNNENSLLLYNKTEGVKFIYGTRDFKKKNQIIATNIKPSKFSIAFDVHVNSVTIKQINVSLLGVHVVENILPAIAIAHHLGVSEDLIKKGLNKIRPLNKTMQPLQSNRGAVYIDDSFNANPQSVVAAAHYMAIFEGKKYFVLQPMIELGSYGRAHHRKIGEIIGSISDYLFLTNGNYYDEIKEGIQLSGGKCKVAIMSYNKCAQKIKEDLQGEDDVCIFEGKESQNVLTLLQYKKLHEK